MYTHTPDVHWVQSYGWIVLPWSTISLTDHLSHTHTHIYVYIGYIVYIYIYIYIYILPKLHALLQESKNSTFPQCFINSQWHLTCCLTALSGNDFSGSICPWRNHTELISDRLLRQLNGLIIYSKTEWALVITKQIFNYYNSNFSQEMTSEVENVHLHTNWDVKGSEGYINAAFKNQ